MINLKLSNSLEEKLKNAFYGITFRNVSFSYTEFLMLVPNYDSVSETIKSIVENWMFENREELEGYTYITQSCNSLMPHVNEYYIRIEKKII